MHWFDETEEEKQRRETFNESVTVSVPADADPKVATKHIHLMESDGPQQSWETTELEREFLEEILPYNPRLIVAKPDDLASHLIYSFCGIDPKDHHGPPLWMMMPIRLWQHDKSKFRSVNCRTCRGAYLFELRRKREEAKADFLEIVWTEQYGEVNSDCNGVHYMSPAPSTLVCTKCGRTAEDLQDKDEQTIFP